MANQGSAAHQAASARVSLPPAPKGVPTAAQMIGTGPAALIIGKDPRTVERWVSRGWLAGGRRTDPVTGEPVKGSHRWVDVRHAVLIAVGDGRADQVPEEWRHLIPQEVRRRPVARQSLPAGRRLRSRSRVPSRT